MKRRRASRARRNFRKIFLLAVILSVGSFFVIQGGASFAATTHNLVKYPKNKMTRLTLKKVYVDKRPKGMGSLQGFTMTDKYYVLIMRPPGQEDNNRIEIIRRSDEKDVTKSFGNPTYNMGHGNDATWNSKTNEIIVVDGSRKRQVRIDAKTFKKKGTMNLVNSKGQALSASGIAYDKERNIYYTASGSSIRTFNTNNKLVSSFSEKHHQTNQGFSYNNGYFYRPTWESAGTYKDAIYDGIFKKNTTIIYQFGLNGSFTHAYYIDNPLYEVESMAFDEKNVPYIAFNGPSGCFSIYKVTDSNLLKKLRQSYTISYFDNGGSGSPKDQTAYVGIETTISKTKPTRKGYNFLGWSTNKKATKASYKPNTKYLKPYGKSNANVKLYAVWGITQYTVAYNANGGTGAPGSQSIDSNKNATLSKTKPTRSGYTFLGWSTNQKATTAEYQPGATYSGKKTTTFYAVWQINSYTITYNANGGTNAPKAQTANINQPITISTVKPTRSGYTFLGWSTDSKATSAQYAAGAKYTAGKSTTLYAVWQKNTPPAPVVQTITITYDANGGTNAPAATTGYEGKIILSTVRPTRSGYIFLGWSANQSAVKADYQPGASYPGKSSITLYAVWQQLITVTFDANGGESAPSAQQAKYGQEFALTNAKPTRSGYDFLGWNTDKNAKEAKYQPGDKLNLTGNITLYAIWEKNTYTVKFNPNGGSTWPTPVSTRDGEIVIPQTRISRGGYEFVGWDTDKNAKEAKYQPGDIIKDNVQDMTLYAIWQEIANDPSGMVELLDTDAEDENINDASEVNDGEEDATISLTAEEEPEELPETGPAEVVVAIIALVCVGGGVAYWMTSQTQLNKLQRSVRGTKSGTKKHRRK